MKAMALIMIEDGQCILQALSELNEFAKKETMKRGLKNVIEVTAGGTLFIDIWPISTCYFLYRFINNSFKYNRYSYAQTNMRTWGNYQGNIKEITLWHTNRHS